MLGFLHLSDVSYIATAILAGATLFLAIAATWAGFSAKHQIDEQRAIERRRRVYDHSQKLGNTEFAEMTAAAVEVFSAFRISRQFGILKWKNMPANEQARVQVVLNYWEELAMEYNLDFLDRTLMDRSLAYVAIDMWDIAEPLTAWFRERNPLYLEEWWKLYENRDEIR